MSKIFSLHLYFDERFEYSSANFAGFSFLQLLYSDFVLKAFLDFSSSVLCSMWFQASQVILKTRPLDIKIKAGDRLPLNVTVGLQIFQQKSVELGNKREIAKHNFLFFANFLDFIGY